MAGTLAAVDSASPLLSASFVSEDAALLVGGITCITIGFCTADALRNLALQTLAYLHLRASHVTCGRVASRTCRLSDFGTPTPRGKPGYSASEPQNPTGGLNSKLSRGPSH